jgi:hypothetical protein
LLVLGQEGRRTQAFLDQGGMRNAMKLRQGWDFQDQSSRKRSRKDTTRELKRTSRRKRLGSYVWLVLAK